MTLLPRSLFGHRISMTILCRVAAFGLIGGFAFLTAGCVSSDMSATTSNVPPPVPADKAQVVFMRPSMFGGAIQSSIYEVHGDNQDFIGIVSAKTKVAYNVPAGEHLFMVVAENADFMIAHVQPGKTYYALVSPRMGVWKARFSLLPIHNDPAAKYNLNGQEFADWNKATNFVELNDGGRQWYQDNAASVSDKRKDYMVKWNSMLPEDKANLILNEKDGVSAAPAP